MAILVSGSTGTIGSQVLDHLRGQDVEVRALTRSGAQGRLPDGVQAVQGDLTDTASLRKALTGVSTLFLLIPNVADELTHAMLSLKVAQEAGVRGIVYLSVLKSETYADVPHFAGKYTAERMIHALQLPATVLRPAYFMQNDLRQRDPLTKNAVYAQPVGAKGVSMVDTRDIGAAAAIELVRRERASSPLQAETYAMVGPEALTGNAIAGIWSEVLGQPVRYVQEDGGTYEKRLAAILPPWHALDLRLMFDRYQSDGAAGSAEDSARLTRLLGRPARSYRQFAQEAHAQWQSAKAG